MQAIELLRASCSAAREAFIDDGGSYAASRLAARATLLGHINEEVGGLAYYRAARQQLCHSWHSNQ